MTTVGALIDLALGAHARLAELAESIEDEWQYVADLGLVWRARLEHVVAARGNEPVEPAVAEAVHRAMDEIGRIEDAHRAIDWLSTFPQVVLHALGEGS